MTEQNMTKLNNFPISIATAESYTWGEGCDAWFLVKNAQLTVIQELMPVGAAERLHVHYKSRQFFYILSGVATIEHGSVTVDLRSGEGLEIAPFVAHRILNRSTTDLSFLVISEPPSRGDRIDLQESSSQTGTTAT